MVTAWYVHALTRGQGYHRRHHVGQFSSSVEMQRTWLRCLRRSRSRKVKASLLVLSWERSLAVVYRWDKMFLQEKICLKLSCHKFQKFKGDLHLISCNPFWLEKSWCLLMILKSWRSLAHLLCHGAAMLKGDFSRELSLLHTMLRSLSFILI